MDTQNIEHRINNACILAFGMQLSELRQKNNRRVFSDKRHIVSHWLRHNTRLTLYSIGKMLHRDHATTLHGIVAIDNLFKTKDKNIMAMYENFSKYASQVDYMPVVHYLVDLPEFERNFIFENVEKMLEETK
jgi:chromosomal replication initiation ATPase DnaA